MTIFRRNITTGVTLTAADANPILIAGTITNDANTETGVLSYDPDGSAVGFAASPVATLTGHPSLSAGSAGNLFFVS